MSEAELLQLMRRGLDAYLRFDFADYGRILEAARGAVSASGDPPALMGEYVLLAALPQWTQAEALAGALERAYALIGGPSRVFPHKAPLLLEAYDPFGTFWLKPGTAESTFAFVKRAEEMWGRLNGGGQGTAALYLAQLRYYQGRLPEALRLALESYRMAREHGQMMTQLCAAGILCMLSRHGMGSAREAADFLDRICREEEAVPRGIFQTAQLIRCEFYLSIGTLTAVPEWMRAGDFGAAACPEPPGWYMAREKLSPFLVPYAFLVRMHCLYAAGRFVDALNHADMVQRVFGICYPIIDIYLDFWRCACYDGLGDSARLPPCLRRILTSCIPDELWLIPGEDEPHLPALTELAEEYGLDVKADLEAMGRGLFDALRPMREGYLRAAVLKDMTRQEYAVARLVYSGASNAQVAGKLNISEQTVKNHLRRVYEKLNIHNRWEIVEALGETSGEIYAVWAGSPGSDALK